MRSTPATGGVVAALKDDLAPYELSKGTIRFPFSRPVPAGLIRRIASIRAKETRASQTAAKTKAVRPKRR